MQELMYIEREWVESGFGDGDDLWRCALVALRDDLVLDQKAAMLSEHVDGMSVSEALELLRDR
jgi:hypothetical protein